MYYYDTSERLKKNLAPGANTRTFWGDSMLVSLLDLDPNSEVPLHTHPHEQIGFVLEGEVEMTIGGEVKLMRPGEMYIVPGGLEHGGRTGNSSTRLLDIFSPVRDEYKY